MRICRHCKKRNHWSDECFHIYGSKGAIPVKKAQAMMASSESMQDKIDAAVAKAIMARAPDVDIDSMACAAVSRMMIMQPAACPDPVPLLMPPPTAQDEWRAQMDAAFA